MAGVSKPPNIQCTQLKSGILLGEGKEVREGRERKREKGKGERETEKCRERKEQKKQK